MATLKDLIKENFGSDEQIVIPWDLHETITLEDIAFISLQEGPLISDDGPFALDEEFYSHIECKDLDYSWKDSLEIKEKFNNFENTCFLFEILSVPRYCKLTHAIKSDDTQAKPEPIFSEKFLSDVRDYALEHDLLLESFGMFLQKLYICYYIDREPFTSKYLGRFGPKRAN